MVGVTVTLSKTCRTHHLLLKVKMPQISPRWGSQLSRRLKGIWTKYVDWSNSTKNATKFSNIFPKNIKWESTGLQDIIVSGTASQFSTCIKNGYGMYQIFTTLFWTGTIQAYGSVPRGHVWGVQIRTKSEPHWFTAVRRFGRSAEVLHTNTRTALQEWWRVTDAST